jgi:hypothetical protein
MLAGDRNLRGLFRPDCDALLYFRRVQDEIGPELLARSHRYPAATGLWPRRPLANFVVKDPLSTDNEVAGRTAHAG